VDQDGKTLHFPEYITLLNVFELQFSKFIFVSLQFNFLWCVVNSIQNQLINFKGSTFLIVNLAQP